ncbi:MAG: hypothetical protein ACI80V_001926 [Rhodothermales bacterium]|jgi:hypothetical protein
MARSVLIVLSLLLVGRSAAQDAPESNVALLSAMAASCLNDVAVPDSVFFTPPGRLPFLRGALVDALQSRGKAVFASASSARGELVTDLERAGVSYQRGARSMISRTVSLALTVELKAGDGRILHDELCTRSSVDVVDRSLIASLEDSAYPETRGTIPLSRWQRLAQPVIIATATAAGTLLFFSLRSRRADGG